MLTYIAILWVGYLVTGPWADPLTFSFPYSAPIATAARLPPLVGGLHGGLILLAAAAVLLFAVDRGLRWGYELRVTGDAPLAADLWRHQPGRHHPRRADGGGRARRPRRCDRDRGLDRPPAVRPLARLRFHGDPGRLARRRQSARHPRGLGALCRTAERRLRAAGGRHPAGDHGGDAGGARAGGARRGRSRPLSHQVGPAGGGAAREHRAAAGRSPGLRHADPARGAGGAARGARRRAEPGGRRHHADRRGIRLRGHEPCGLGVGGRAGRVAGGCPVRPRLRRPGGEPAPQPGRDRPRVHDPGQRPVRFHRQAVHRRPARRHGRPGSTSDRWPRSRSWALPCSARTRWSTARSR